METKTKQAAERPLEELTEHELLVEIARDQKRSARNGRIAARAAAVLAAVFLILLLVLVPVIRQASGTLAEAESLVAQLQGSLELVDELTENLNSMVTSNTDTVNKALSQVGKLDIDSLNQSIRELADILAPLARLFGR